MENPAIYFGNTVTICGPLLKTSHPPKSGNCVEYAVQVDGLELHSTSISASVPAKYNSYKTAANCYYEIDM